MELYSNEAEASLLSCLLFRPALASEVVREVAPLDFYREKHRAIYRAIIGLAQGGKDIDIVTVTNALQHTGELEKIGGLLEVTGLADLVPTAANYKSHIGIIKDFAKRRKLVGIGEALIGIARDMTAEPDASECLTQITELATGKGKASEMPMLDSCVDFSTWLNERAEHEYNGVMTGFAPLDLAMMGMEAGELIVLAARPSMGKSALAINIALNAAMKGVCVAFYSLEMARVQVMSRMVSMASGVGLQRILQPRGLNSDEWAAIIAANEKLSKLKLFIVDTPLMTPLGVSASVQRISAKNPVGLVVIDYLQYMESGRKKDENQTLKIGYISGQLKAMAKRLNVPVLALAQLSRGVESRSDKRPELSDLRDSGNIEQDADKVLMMYREKYYDPQSANDTTEIAIKKARMGRTGKVYLRYVPEFTCFKTVPQHEPVADKDIPL